MKGLSVYIRPLQIEDAAVSYAWRNNPKIWRFTGSKPDRVITPEIEKAWLENVLQRKNEKRFAICLKECDTYIGNIFLTNIENNSALIHIFIGAIENWGNNRAAEAMCLMLDYAFADLGLQNVYGLIDKNNTMSIAIARNFQCRQINTFIDAQTGKEMIQWQFDKSMFDEKIHIQAVTAQPIAKGF